MPNPAGPAGRIAAAKAMAQGGKVGGGSSSGGGAVGGSVGGGNMVGDPAAELMARLGALGSKDLSMSGAAMDETQYEMKDDSDVEQDSRDEIDDFERRLAGGAPRVVAKPRPLAKMPPPSGKANIPVPGAAGVKPGADYVSAAQQRKKPAQPLKKAAASADDDGDRDDVKQAMKDLDRFGFDHGDDSD